MVKMKARFLQFTEDDVTLVNSFSASRKMGKASRRKSEGKVAPEALQMAADLVLAPSVLEQFQSQRLFNSLEKVKESQAALDAVRAINPAMGTELPAGGVEAMTLAPVTPEVWAAGMKAAFANEKFSEMLNASIVLAHRSFWGSNPDEALKGLLGSEVQGFHTVAPVLAPAYRRLTASETDPGWIALALFSIGRMIAVTGRREYESNQWTEASLLLFDVERAWLQGEGKALASLLVRYDAMAFRGKLAELLGPRMLHGLAEAAANIPEARLFSKQR